MTKAKRDAEITESTQGENSTGSAPARSTDMRMTPLHRKRKFWWELVFIGVLLFLLAGVRLQKKPEVVAAVVPVLLVPVAEWGAIAAPLPPLLN